MAVAFLLGMGMPVLAQDLSSQVLALLTRTNYWTAPQTFANIVGVTLEPGNFQPPVCANTLTNLNGALYFNCVLIAASGGPGTVTSVALSGSGIFSITGSPITTTGTINLGLATENANLVWAGPTTGAAATPTFRGIVGADLPNPSTTTLGGIEAIVAVSHNFIKSISASGVPALGQPVFADLGSTPTTFAGYGISDTVTNLMTAISSGVSGTGNFVLVTGATLIAPNLGTPASGVGTNLTGLNATNLASGSVPCARYTALTGDVTTSGCAATLASTAVTPGSYGDATHSGQFTVDAKGRLTAAASVLITVPTVSLTSGVSGILPIANGGTALSAVPTNGQLLIGNGSGYALASLTGTTNQLIVTPGAGSIVLSLPQSINTTSSPTFACVGAGGACSATEVLNFSAGQPSPGYVAAGNCGAALTINFNSGVNQTSTLNAATCTFSFSNPIVGNTYRLNVVQDATGSRLVTWPGTVAWFGGSAPTLSTGANKRDLCSFFWTGAAYLGTCLIGA